MANDAIEEITYKNPKKINIFLDFYFSVIELDLPTVNTYKNKLSIDGNTLFVWCVWDIYPSNDVYRNPIFVGYAQSKSEIIGIATQMGLLDTLFFGNSEEVNKKFNYWVNSGYLYSYTTKSKGVHYIEWKNFLDFVFNFPPRLEWIDVDSNQVFERIANLDYYLRHPAYQQEYSFSEYLQIIKQRETLKSCNKNIINLHIKRCTARKKYQMQKNEQKLQIVDFLYTQNHRSGKTIWSRHRIVKTTKEYIFVEKLPYLGKRYTQHDWEMFVLFSYKIPIKSIVEMGFSSIKSNESIQYKKIFYTKDYLKSLFTDKRKKPKFDWYNQEEDDVFDPIVVMPADEKRWALKILNIPPNTKLNKHIIKKAFIKMSFEHHPDKGGDGKKFIECKSARDFLLDNL